MVRDRLTLVFRLFLVLSISKFSSGFQLFGLKHISKERGMSLFTVFVTHPVFIYMATTNQRSSRYILMLQPDFAMYTSNIINYY